MSNSTTITTNNTGDYMYSNGLTTIGLNINDINGGYSTTGTIYIDNSIQFEPWEAVNFLEMNNDLASILATAYKKIVNNCIYFNVYIDGKTVRPIDDILLMIKKKETFNIKISRSGYEILISNARFTKIKNLIETSAKEYIKVEFEYDNIDYQNVLKTDIEKRSEKMNLLKHKIDKKNDI